MFWYGFDMYYVILVLPAFVLAMIAQAKVSGTFRKYSKIESGRNITGAEAARQVLQQNSVYGVTIESIDGKLTDHYDPKANVIRLSSSVYGSKSVAAIGVAAHEAGHAVQYAKEYGPVKVRTAIIPISQIGSTAAFPLVLIGLIFSSNMLFAIGLMFFLTVTIFQLVTLPVEFNASRRAVAALETGNILDDRELSMAKKTLMAAALTYVAALAVSVAQLLRLVLIFSGGNRE